MKKKMKKEFQNNLKRAAAFCLAAMLVPGVSVIADDAQPAVAPDDQVEYSTGLVKNNQALQAPYDQDGDGTFTKKDASLMLEAIFHNQEGSDEKMDVNESGTSSIEDLFVLMMGTKWYDRYDEVLKGRFANILAAKTEQFEKDGSYEVQLQFMESVGLGDYREKLTIMDQGSMGYFDYAIVYDKEKIKVENIEWSSELLEKFPQENGTDFGNEYLVEDRGDYVMFGGYLTGLDDTSLPQTLATVTFSYVDESEETGDLLLCHYATQNDTDSHRLIYSSRDYPVLLGDTNEDDEITLKDIQTMLRYYLNIESLNYPVDFVDVDMDGKLTLQDIRKTLKMFLKLEDKEVRMLPDGVERHMTGALPTSEDILREHLVTDNF